MTLIASCKTQQSDIQPTETTTAPAFRGGGNAAPPMAMVAPTVIYKTHGDYDNLVPITLDDTGTRIVSYPAPSDLRRGENFSTPVTLDGGYLLDRRGLTANSVFTDYTYEQYSILPTAPTTTELMKHIKYRKPFAEMYVIDGTSQLSVKQLNDIIANGFEGCRTIIRDKAETK